MSKKWKKKYHQDQERPGNHQQPPAEGDPIRPSVYAIRIEPSADDKNKDSEEREYWIKQIRVGKALNRISACGAGIALLALIALVVNAVLVRK